jgi:site-specific DNA-methyltransferase (adenine-specific)
MATLDAESVDSIVTDPPYGLSFMGRDWDHGVPGEAFWREALRVAKPGAHLLAFGGSRTYHRLACAIEDAGWEIRDCIMWVYGSGFPKSHNLSGDWQGWGTALKPAYEPIIVARKPLIGTVAANVQQYGTGAINVDGCRVGPPIEHQQGGLHRGSGTTVGSFTGTTETHARPHARWPANFIHDGSDEVIAGLGESARFFYCAKASKKDRDEGCESFQPRLAGVMNMRSDNHAQATGNIFAPKSNHHPTVKPTDLMRYLCRLVTPPGGTVLDPFMGSGSTGKGATLEGFNFIGIEQNAEYVEIAKARIKHAIDSASKKLFLEPV